MTDESEQAGFRQIGNLLPSISPSPSSAGSTASPPPSGSAITGSQSPARRDASSTGTPHGATGADASMNSRTDQRSASAQLPALPPASPRRSPENVTMIAAEISRLMSHYWAANEDPRLRAAIAADWLDDLREFDAEWVRDACRDWRRSQAKRPTIADIRARCVDTAERYRRPPPRREPTHDERVAAARKHGERETRYAAAFAWRQQFAEERGFPDFTAVMQYGIIAAYKLPIKSSEAPAHQANEIL